MNPDTNTSNHRSSLLIPALLLLIIVGAGIFLYLKQTPSKKDVYQSSFEEGATLMGKGDSRAKYKFEEALRAATTLEQEAVAKLNVATAYFSSDPIKAVEELKAIYSTSAYPTSIRAGTIDYMIQWYSGTFDLDLVENHILTGGQPWESFKVNVKDSSFTIDDANLSLRLAAEHAAAIQSIFTLEYGIAFFYSHYELFDNSQNKEKLEKYKTIILERINKGDKDIERKKAYKTPVRDSQYGFGLFYKALALTNLYDAGSYTNVGEIENNYLEAISYQEKVPRIGLAVGARMYYIRFLIHLNNEVANERIKDQIAILLEKGIANNQDYKIKLTNFIKDSRYNKDLAKIANFSQPFKDLLVSLGWKG